MQARIEYIDQFLKQPSTIFVVPVFQRNYDWTEDSCKQLFRDIETAIDDKKEHFLGTICIKGSGSHHELSIIDGQQRLTSISLMMKALYDLLDDDSTKSSVDKFLHNSSRGISDSFKAKMHLNERDDAVYRIILDREPAEREAYLTNAQESSRIYQNYQSFCKLLTAYSSKGGNLSSLVTALGLLTIVELEIEDENPQQIFQSLNSTGLNLNQVDLLRNSLLMQFDYNTQKALYNDYWTYIENAVGADNMEQFFVDYLVFKRRSDSIRYKGKSIHLTEAKLYDYFRGYYHDQPGTEESKIRDLFSGMKSCAGLYKDFFFDADSNLINAPLIQVKLYFMLTELNSMGTRCLLLYLYDLHKQGAIDEVTRDAAIDAIHSLLFRARVCNGRGINRQFAGNVIAKLEDTSGSSKPFINRFWDAITSGKGGFSFPLDSKFRDNLLHTNIFDALRSNGTKYMLYMLQLGSKFSRGLPSYNEKTLSVEHIMPQNIDKWNDLTDETRSQHDDLVNRLGNLALTNYNGTMSNKPFKEKKTIYKGDQFYYTKLIADSNTWQAADIERRGEFLADEAVKVWSMPPEYQPMQASNLYALTVDPTQFANTQPDLLYFGNAKFPVDSWISIIITLCKELNSNNHQMFFKASDPGILGCFKRDPGDNSIASRKVFRHVIDNLYIRYMGSRWVIENMMKLISRFDALAGTDLLNTTHFSIKLSSDKA